MYIWRTILGHPDFSLTDLSSLVPASAMTTVSRVYAFRRMSKIIHLYAMSFIRNHPLISRSALHAHVRKSNGVARVSANQLVLFRKYCISSTLENLCSKEGIVYTPNGPVEVFIMPTDIWQRVLQNDSLLLFGGPRGILPIAEPQQ